MGLIGCGKNFNDSHVNAIQKVREGALLIDVRSEAEYLEGYLEGSMRITHTDILQGVNALNIDKGTPIVLYCRSGNRSGQAATALQNAGFTAITNGGAYESLLAASNN
ncbi:MAG TPA: rhodanese-like domain-containing protein [Pseudomonadales bacterium]|nr:rhodanese-like domain-containing protein [Pseudomonadales bacterium]